MVELKKGQVTAKISEIGAELKSFRIENKEYIWHGDEQIWANSTLVLFPICGGLIDDRYLFEGKEYHIPKHGFGWLKTYTVEKQTDDSVTLLLVDDEETYKVYPFHFEFRVTYQIEGDGMKVGYHTTNTGKGIMYFAVGAHEGYYTPEGIEQYDVIFPQKETLENCLCMGEAMSDTATRTIIKNSVFLPLYDEYFYDDSLVFRTMKSRSCNLRNRINGKEIHIEYPGLDYFLLWHKHGAPYICLEPWGCLPDTESTDHVLAHKPGMKPLDPGETKSFVHSFTVVSR